MRKILILSCILTVSLSFLIIEMIHSHTNQIIYEDIQEIGIIESDDRIDELEVDFNALHQINPDIFAWIHIEDTTISYPVVLGEDNEYYLNHTVNGEESIAGSIFMDYENDRKLSHFNNILYGHYVYGGIFKGTMFSNLHKYQERSFFDDHPTYKFMTEDTSYQVEIFSVYISHVSQSSWKIHFYDEMEYQAWLKEVISLSIYDTNISVDISDRVLTLSTCTSEADDIRLIIHGRLLELN